MWVVWVKESRVCRWNISSYHIQIDNSRVYLSLSQLISGLFDIALQPIAWHLSCSKPIIVWKHGRQAKQHWWELPHPEGPAWCDCCSGTTSTCTRKTRWRGWYLWRIPWQTTRGVNALDLWRESVTALSAIICRVFVVFCYLLSVCRSQPHSAIDLSIPTPAILVVAEWENRLRPCVTKRPCRGYRIAEKGMYSCDIIARCWISWWWMVCVVLTTI